MHAMSAQMMDPFRMTRFAHANYSFERLADMPHKVFVGFGPRMAKKEGLARWSRGHPLHRARAWLDLTPPSILSLLSVVLSRPQWPQLLHVVPLHCTRSAPLLDLWYVWPKDDAVHSRS